MHKFSSNSCWCYPAWHRVSHFTSFPQANPMQPCAAGIKSHLVTLQRETWPRGPQLSSRHSIAPKVGRVCGSFLASLFPWRKRKTLVLVWVQSPWLPGTKINRRAWNLVQSLSWHFSGGKLPLSFPPTLKASPATPIVCQAQQQNFYPAARTSLTDVLRCTHTQVLLMRSWPVFLCPHLQMSVS